MGGPTDSFCLGEGTHKGRPYRFVLPWGGHPPGAPLPIRFALGRVPTRGAPTDSFCLGEGTHKGRPYRFVLPWGGHPQGAPLPDSFCPGEGTHKGRPYPIRFALGRVPTRGAPTRFRQPHVGLSQYDAIALGRGGGCGYSFWGKFDICLQPFLYSFQPIFSVYENSSDETIRLIMMAVDEISIKS